MLKALLLRAPPDTVSMSVLTAQTRRRQRLKETRSTGTKIITRQPGRRWVSTSPVLRRAATRFATISFQGISIITTLEPADSVRRLGLMVSVSLLERYIRSTTIQFIFMEQCLESLARI